MNVDTGGLTDQRNRPFSVRLSLRMGVTLLLMLGGLLTVPAGLAAPATSPPQKQPVPAVKKHTPVKPPLPKAKVVAPSEHGRPKPPSAIKPPAPPIREQVVPPSAEGSADVTPGSSDSQDLETLYRENRERQQFTSSSYLLRVFGLLALLLGGFYLTARTLLPRWLQSGQPLIPFAQTPDTAETPVVPPVAPGKHRSDRSWLSAFFSGSRTPASTVRPKILGRTRVGPGKEILVVQVGSKHLVLGSTAQQMTLLTELPEASSEPGSEMTLSQSLLAQRDKAVYRKYLSPPGSHQAAHRPHSPDTLPTHEEITLLTDYEDQFDPR